MHKRSRQEAKYQVLEHLAAPHLEVNRRKQHREQHGDGVVDPPGPACVLSELGECHPADDDDKSDPKDGANEMRRPAATQNQADDCAEDDVRDKDENRKSNPGFQLLSP